jgi:GAF domain-containing protein
VASDTPARVAAATKRLRAETDVPGLLGATAQTFVELLDATACTISRAIGDLLVDLIQHRKVGAPDRLGHGYLISDYPLTREVIEQREPRTVSLDDPKADPAEAKLLRELGFHSLLMVALESQNEPWGLIEVYGAEGRQFTGEDVEVLRTLAAEVGGLLDGLGRPV